MVYSSIDMGKLESMHGRYRTPDCLKDPEARKNVIAGRSPGVEGHIFL